MIITFIDTETTGLDLLQHEVIEIGMLRVHVDKNWNHSKMECFEAKIKPKFIKRASPQALKVNGYTADKCKKAVKAVEILPIYKEWVETSDIIAGQNLIFDYNFINQLFDRENLERPKYPKYYDTKKMAEQLVKDGTIKRTSLDYLCENFNIRTTGRAHTALADVMRTYELFKILCQTVKPSSLSFKKPYDPFAERKKNV